jgi:hypothetical protein
MPRYTAPMLPEVAAVLYRGEPGNYIAHFQNGDAYAGRQGPNVDRISAHLRRHGDDLIAVQFQRDSQDDACVRAAREQAAVARLLNDGVPVRNKTWPNTPAKCRRR